MNIPGEQEQSQELNMEEQNDGMEMPTTASTELEQQLEMETGNG
jgi:hypothetical protein